MLDKEILSKLVSEQPLTAAEALRLDEALDSEGERAQGLLDACDDVAPSYAWRSSLNQRLAATKQAKKPRLKLVFGWAGGLTAVAASTLAILRAQNTAKPTPGINNSGLAKASPSFEEALLTSHMQGATQSNVGAAPVQEPDDQVFDWSKLDKS